MRWSDLRRLLTGIALGATAVPASANPPLPSTDPDAALYPSGFGCSKLHADAQTPILEGKEGVFYRVYADIRMHHPFSDRTIDLLAQLSQTLAEQGTTLLFLPIPTKSQAMPDHLPDVVRHYGYKRDVSAAVYQDIVDRLRAAGVVTIHGQNAMLAAEPGTMPYFQADFHWNAEGARLAAMEVGREIAKLPHYAELETSEFETVQTGTEVAFSGLRQLIQRNCLEPVPEPVTATWRTEKVETETGVGLDLFGDEETRIDLAVVGTSFSDMDLANFDGWLSQHTGLDVINYAITGGNQFGSILSYLTSDDFRNDRPRFLLWENPIYNNLLQYGEQPLLELVAAAGQSCDRPLAAKRSAADRLEVSLGGAGLTEEDVVLADAGAEGPATAEFHLVFADGARRVQRLERGERLRHTGRFYLPAKGYDARALSSVEVVFDRPVSDAASLSLCSNHEDMP